MNRYVVAVVAVLCIAMCLSVFAKPGGGRLPGGVYDEIMRSQVLAPGELAPEAEYILISAGDISAVQLAELGALGLSVEASLNGYTRVRGPLTSFAALGPDGHDLSWVEAVVPSSSYLTDDDGIPASQVDELSVEDLLQFLGVDELHREDVKGQGVKIAVLDGGFTGELEELLPGHVQYLQIIWTGNVPQLVERYEYGLHGEACAQALAAVAPLATYYLITIADPVDVEALIGFLRDGTLHFDVMSQSIGWSIPADHGDARGYLAAQAEELTNLGIAFFQSSGNYAAGVDTSRSFFAGTFSNLDGETNRYHDFDPTAADTLDRNTLAVEVAPWSGAIRPRLQVVLEWDGWPWQVKDHPNIWTRDSMIKIQDLDLVLYHKTAEGRQRVAVAEGEQMAALTSPVVPLQPLEILTYTLSAPGSYLVGVANNTTQYDERFRPYERAVGFHMYVSLSGATFTMEHYTPGGSLLNVSAANVSSVGAVGRIGSKWEVMSFSSRGPTSDGRRKPEFVCPNYYWSPVLENYFGGTSAATPIAAGIAALLHGSSPLLSRPELLEALAETAVRLCDSGIWNGPCATPATRGNNIVGYGLPDAWQAYLSVQQ